MSLPTPYYQDDSVTIYHGDCYEIAPLIEGVDALITDPPYGMALDTGYSRFNGGKTYAAVNGDDAMFDPSPWLYPRTILWGANHYASRLTDTGSWLVWDKRNPGVTNLLSDAELAWCSFPTPVRVFRHMWMAANRQTERGFHVHPTQKPVALMRWCIDQFTKPNDLILDPFMGSGPIARAAKDLGRRYVGIEIEEQYVKAAVARCRQEVLL